MDEEGYFIIDQQRLEDLETGQALIRNLKLSDTFELMTNWQGQAAIVEAFDSALVARHVQVARDGRATIDLAYQTQAQFNLAQLSVDEWDRFHGLTEQGVPFVFSRQAQMEFFDALDEFDDESITVKGTRYAVPPWLNSHPEGNESKFWTQIYNTESPGWDLGREAVCLPSILPQLRLSKARVLVLGCGNGHDAAYFAEHGHVVTGVDFSEVAIQKAQQLYGSRDNLRFIQGDAFRLPENWAGQFDVIFEHTLYCAVSPDRRNELVRQWRRLLQPQGHLLGVFFVMEKRLGPPFGGSEWEVRSRLQKDFRALYWTRWRHSLPGRQGKELVVYAQRR